MANKKTFSTIKNNVGSNIQDTSTSMLTLIGTFVNRRYFQVLRSINWEVINDDYTISVTGGTADYDLPSDFGKEVYVVDTTNNIKIDRVDFQDLARYYTSALTSSGEARRYVIWEDDSGTKKIKFHYTPSSSITVAMPYIVSPSAMTDTDYPVLDFGDLLEIGAEADAWRYKRQFAKASTLEAIFTKNLSEYIWENENRSNQILQLKPETFNRDLLY